jgi:LmbE family N-acetylglucosaminyl deacetylase
MGPVAALGRVLVVSPHLDDAVFGCGELLAACPGSIVTTVFAGAPKCGELTEWDAAAGFRAGQDVMAARREEDQQALTIVGASPLWLDFCDSQYQQRSPCTQTLTMALESVLAQHKPDTVVIPFGLFHSDHKRVHEAALALLKRCQHWIWLAYEDTFYRRIPGLLQERLAALLCAGIAATPVALALRGCQERKRRAVRCYASQLRALATPGRPGHLDAFSPEAYWRLTLCARHD